ncbi:MAG TPA: ABC transporter ATP-binding protein [Casimicrobiaceae bacterium]|nr:ABC transporter ATP-binding protein [Casimicrobiaceae bacterium]
MAALTLDRIGKRFGHVEALDDVSLDVADGEFVAVLGPSGCGKSTLLRVIAGFERADRGSVRFGETLVSGEGVHLPPEDRHVGMVFQSYALWPHMSVAENIGYPLRVRRLARRELAREVDAALAAVGLVGYADRRPAQLSGGQRQRVALARCLAMKARIVLLDEPLANLDVQLRARMLAEIAAFRKLSQATLIYVTHDQAEALGVADRVAVMAGGRVHQVAAPAALYRTPADGVVSRFVGPGAVARGEVTKTYANGHAQVALFGREWQVRSAPGQERGDAEICIRPEDLAIVPAEDGFPASVQRVLYQGGRTVIEAAPAAEPDTTLALSIDSSGAGAIGATVHLALVDGWVIPAAPHPDPLPALRGEGAS